MIAIPLPLSYGRGVAGVGGVLGGLLGDLDLLLLNLLPVDLPRPLSQLLSLLLPTGVLLSLLLSLLPRPLHLMVDLSLSPLGLLSLPHPSLPLLLVFDIMSLPAVLLRRILFKTSWTSCWPGPPLCCDDGGNR